MKKSYLVLIFIFCCASVHAQWQSIAVFQNYVEDMIVYDNLLYLGGNFGQRDGQTAQLTTRYNGTSFQDDTTAPFGFVGQFGIYDNTLFGAGNFASIGLAERVGNAWNTNPTISKTQFTMFADSTGYYLGDYGGAVIHFDGSNFNNYPILDSGSFFNTILDIVRYNGEVYVTGAFTLNNASSLSRIVRYDGNAWQDVGGGIDGFRVWSLEVYDGQLIAGGEFTTAGSTQVNGIAAWDGQSWTPVGPVGAPSVAIYDMLVNNGELYVGGDFSAIGNVNGANVAKWDGSQWTTFPLTESNDLVDCIEVYQGELYACTYGSNESTCYRYSTSTNAENSSSLPDLQIAQSAEQISFSWQDTKWQTPLKATLYSTDGRQIQAQDNCIGQVTFDIHHLPVGVYFVALEDPLNQELTYRRKIVHYR